MFGDWDYVLIVILLIIVIITYFYYRNYHNAKGRISGGLFLIYATIGEGKSYILTALAIEFLKQGRKVFTNFPVIYEGLCSLYWDRGMMHKNVNGSVIIVDEGYRDYSSRFYKSFTLEDHSWFATLGHNEITMYIATQNPQRVDLIIRELVNIWLFVRKIRIPLLMVPLMFVVEYYISEQDMAMSKYKDGLQWYKERFWFRKDIANAYDTKFFKKDEGEPYKGITWIEYNKTMGLEYIPFEMTRLQVVSENIKIKLRDMEKLIEGNKLFQKVLRIEIGVIDRIEKVKK